MVNETASKILQELKSSTKTVSGEQLASFLNISRVAVWKNVLKLRDEGYSIKSEHRGYKLLKLTDKPLPQEIETLCPQSEYFSCIESTMKKANNLIAKGCKDGTIIIAESQTEGVSINGKRWLSPVGGLYLSRIRTKPFPAVFIESYNKTIAQACFELLKKYSVNVEIHNNGELFVNDYKIGGVFTEFKGSGGTILNITAGIGINLKKSMVLPKNAISLEEIASKEINIKLFTQQLIKELNEKDQKFLTKTGKANE